jgi:hypothetical protein
MSVKTNKTNKKCGTPPWEFPGWRKADVGDKPMEKFRDETAPDERCNRLDS